MFKLRNLYCCDKSIQIDIKSEDIDQSRGKHRKSHLRVDAAINFPKDNLFILNEKYSENTDYHTITLC